MTENIVVPVFPESINDGLLSAIYKKVGEQVAVGDVIADIETDKVLLEIPSTVTGVIEEVLEQEGATVISGQVIIKVNTQSSTNSVVEDNVIPAVNQKNNINSSNTTAIDKYQGSKPMDDVILSPAAQKMINEKQVDVSEIGGTGKDGRIMKQDVIMHISRESDSSSTVHNSENNFKPSNNSNSNFDSNLKLQPEINIAQQRMQKRVPMSRLRSRIAERLLQAQQNAAILTTFNEVNMQAIIELRTKYDKKFQQVHGVRLGFMSFFIKATVEALKQFPEINASTEGEDIIYHGFIDMGVAIGSPRGLVVPIIRDADQLSVANLEKIIVDYSERAKTSKLTLDEITGGTFSITNGGVFGSMLSTPILNPPQSGILGMHKIEKRAVVINDQIVIRPMMYLAFSYDHRIIDGREAVKFLVTIKEELEDPARILLEI